MYLHFKNRQTAWLELKQNWQVCICTNLISIQDFICELWKHRPESWWLFGGLQASKWKWHLPWSCTWPLGDHVGMLLIYQKRTQKPHGCTHKLVSWILRVHWHYMSRQKEKLYSKICCFPCQMQETLLIFLEPCNLVHVLGEDTAISSSIWISILLKTEFCRDMKYTFATKFGSSYNCLTCIYLLRGEGWFQTLAICLCPQERRWWILWLDLTLRYLQACTWHQALVQIACESDWCNSVHSICTRYVHDGSMTHRLMSDLTLCPLPDLYFAHRRLRWVPTFLQSKLPSALLYASLSWGCSSFLFLLLLQPWAGHDLICDTCASQKRCLLACNSM